MQARGYGGGRTVVKDYVGTQRPRATVPAEARFYVKPGQQLQVDWADMGVVTIGGMQRKLYAFVIIMAWSRALFVCCTTDMQLFTWLDCHRRAFEFFGGVPSEVLIDNLKTGVLSRAAVRCAGTRHTKRWPSVMASGQSHISRCVPKPKAASSGSSALCASGYSRAVPLQPISPTAMPRLCSGCESAQTLAFIG